MNAKPPINKTYQLDITQALGNLAQELNIAFADYATFENGVLCVYSSDIDQDTLHSVVNPKPGQKLTTDEKNKIIPWEKYCAPDFLSHCRKKHGFTPKGICIVIKKGALTEHFSLVSNDPNNDLYDRVLNDDELQETITTRVRDYIKKNQTQPIEISLNLPTFSHQEHINEKTFKKLEASQKNKFRKQYQSTAMGSTELDVQCTETLWDLKALQTISADLNISVETVQAYMQLLRRKESNIYDGEVDCLYLAGQGYTAKETARLLNISVHTTREYRQSAIRKLNAKNMTHAVYLAVKKNILS